MHVVTGGAGFIGRHLCRFLQSKGLDVLNVDNGSAGTTDVAKAMQGLGIAWMNANVQEAQAMEFAVHGADAVWHLAANPDVRGASQAPQRHFDDNVHATWTLLEAMRKQDVGTLRFCSTSTVYGEATQVPTPEAYGPLKPISVYGGAKLACEAMIASHAATYGFDAISYRFANVVGPEATHGVIVDFVHKLQANPNELEVLGDGKQTKSYVHVADTVAGMWVAHEQSSPGAHYYNIGAKDWIDVDALAGIVAKEMGLNPTLKHTGGTAKGGGWVGDVPKMHLDTSALESLGWTANYTSREAVADATRSLLDA